MTAHLNDAVRLRRPADLVAVVPYLLGFHPERSIVAMAFEPDPDPGTGSTSLRFTVRVDLPEDSAETPGLARQLVEMLRRNGAQHAALIGYGPGWHVTPVMDAVRGALEAAEIETLDALRVEDDRYWSYLCHDAECCPADGAPYDTTSNPAAAAVVFAGLVAQPDRAAFTATLDPVGGREREQMRAATRDACAETARLLRMKDGPCWYREGIERVEAALDRIHAGQGLSAEAVAWLGVQLTAIFVRDGAMTLIGRYDDETHIRLWTEVTRRVEPEFAAAPAAILAIVALRTGDGSLARVAVDRALSVNPDYGLAGLIAAALRYGLPPEKFDFAGMVDEIAAQAEQHPRGARPMLPEGW